MDGTDKCCVERLVSYTYEPLKGERKPHDVEIRGTVRPVDIGSLSRKRKVVF